MGRLLNRQSVFGLLLVVFLTIVGLVAVLPPLRMALRSSVSRGVGLSQSPRPHAVESLAVSLSDVTNQSAGSAISAAETTWSLEKQSASASGGRLSVDLSPTSWQNPFQADYWNTTGWRFDGSQMVCDPGRSVVATFRRRYRQMMVSLGIEHTSADVEFRLCLTAPSSNTVMDVCFSDREVIVSSGQSAHAQQILGRKAVPLMENPHGSNSVRLAATGNRVQVIWNGRRILTCNQPAGQSRRDVLLSIVAPHGGLRITRLRIEGE